MQGVRSCTGPARPEHHKEEVVNVAESDLGSHPSQIRRRVSEYGYFARLALVWPRNNLKRGLPSTFRKFSVLEVETSNAKVRRGNCVLEKEFRFLAVTQVCLVEHIPLIILYSIPIHPCVPDIAAVFVLEVTGKEEGCIQGGIVKLFHWALLAWNLAHS